MIHDGDFLVVFHLKICRAQVLCSFNFQMDACTIYFLDGTEANRLQKSGDGQLLESARWQQVLTLLELM